MHASLKGFEATVRAVIPKLALSPREAAEALSISEKTLWTATRERGIPHLQLRAGGRVVYPVDQLREWLAKNAIGSSSSHEAAGN